MSATAECKTCRFWRPLEDGAGVGTCRRTSPDVLKGWPTVFDRDWCGEHQPRRVTGKAGDSSGPAVTG